VVRNFTRRCWDTWLLSPMIARQGRGGKKEETGKPLLCPFDLFLFRVARPRTAGPPLAENRDRQMEGKEGGGRKRGKRRPMRFPSTSYYLIQVMITLSPGRDFHPCHFSRGTSLKKEGKRGKEKREISILPLISLTSCHC